MCKYCENNEFEPLNATTDYSGLEIAVSGKGVLRVRNYNFKELFESQDAVDINYCPMCRKEVGRVKTEQEINKEIEKHKEAIKNKMGEKTQDDKIHLWIIQTLEWVIK